MINLSRFLLLGLMFVMPTICHSLVIGATPLDNKEDSLALYQPLAKKLTKALGQEVTFEYSENWLVFSKNLLAGNFDIIITEPHIIAYVTSDTWTLSMSTIAKFQGDLVFNLITKKGRGIRSLSSLKSKRICMLPSPNFSGVLILKEFVNNPVTQPTVFEVRGTYDDVFQAFVDSRCDAALVDSATYKRKAKLDDNIVSIYETPKSPNVGVAASKRIPSGDRQTIASVLLDAQALSGTTLLFEKFADGVVPFEAAKNKEYKPMNILPGVVWGW